MSDTGGFAAPRDPSGTASLYGGGPWRFAGHSATVFARCDAAAVRALLPPPRLYQRSKELEVYFEANPDAWFAGDRYGPWLSQLRGMGVRADVEVRARTPNQLGYVIITLEFGRNERGLGGFDPEAEIDGLRFALEHPGYARSEYAWNVLLAPNRRLVAGVVEHSVLPSFSDVSQERVTSAIAAIAEREAWLPGRDGAFHRPGELGHDALGNVGDQRIQGLGRGLHFFPGQRFGKLDKALILRGGREQGIEHQVGAGADQEQHGRSHSNSNPGRNDLGPERQRGRALTGTQTTFANGAQHLLWKFGG